MRESALLCYMCVGPEVLNFAPRERAAPPDHVKGVVAEREHRCTRCGGSIPEGTGFVYVCSRHPVEGERALHERLCGGADG